MSKLSLHIGSEISLKDFSFSQQIIEVKRLFDTDGIPGFIKMLVILIETLLIKNSVECPHCKSNKAHFHSKSSRKLKTSIGEVNLVLSRLKCVGCAKTFVPFNGLMDLNKYSRKSREFEKLSLETVTNQSFRRSAKNLNDTMGFSTAHTTLHRWFANTDSTNMNVHRKVDFLVADGTGFKRDKNEDGSNRGEIKVLIGYNKSGR
jgi:transposase-like protein